MITVFKKPLTCVLKSNSNSNSYEYLAAIAALTRLRFLPKKKLRAHILFQTVHRVCQSPMQYSYIDHSGPLFSPLFTRLNCLAVVVVFFGMRHFHFCTLHAILMSRPIVHTLRRNIDNDRKKCLTLFKYSRDSHAQSKVTCGALWCLIADVINTFIN